MAGAEHVAEPDEEEVCLELDGEEWRVRVLGRAGACSRGATPLLSVGFLRADCGSDETVREAYVVARTLADVTLETLERAFVEARTVRLVMGKE